MSEKWNHKSEMRYQQKAVIEFLTHEGETAKKIHTHLKLVYGQDVFNVSTARYWAHELGKDYPSHPKLNNRDEIRAKICDKIPKNRRITQTELCNTTSVGVATVNRFVRNLE